MVLLSEILERASGWSQARRPQLLILLNTGSASGTAAVVEAGDVVSGTGTGLPDLRPHRSPQFASSQDGFIAPITRQLTPSGPVLGTAAITESADTVSGTGTLPLTGSGAAVEAADVVSGTGTAVSQSADIFGGQDTLGWPPVLEIWTPSMRMSQIILTVPTGIAGLGNVIEAPDTVSGTGTLAVTGSGATTEASDIVSGSGTLSVTGTGAATEAADVVSGVGVSAGTGVGAATEAADTVSGTGTLSATGTAAITEAPDVVAGAGTAGNFGIGSAAITESADTVAGTGTVATTGSASIIEPADTVAGTGDAGGIGAAAIVESADIASGSGTAGVIGIAGIVEPGDVVAGTGATSVTGTASITEGPDVVSGAGAGQAAILESPDQVAGVGVIQNPARFGKSTMTVNAQIILEESTCFVTVNFIDSDGNPFLPASAQYRLDDVPSGAQILGWTTLTNITASMTITVTAAQNAMINATRKKEVHQMLVQLTDGFGNVDIIFPPARWDVLRVAGLA